MDCSSEVTVAPKGTSAASRICLKHKLLLALPVPLAIYLVMQGISVMGETHADPSSLGVQIAGLAESFYFMGGLSCLILSLRIYRKIQAPPRG